MKLRSSSKPLVMAVTLAALELTSSIVVAEALVLDAIIVTAQKRPQGLQDVPISINAVSKERLDAFNVTSLSSLSSSVPNLLITRNGLTNQIGMRGVFSGSNKGFEQSVAMYMDEVYYGRDQLIQLPVVDLARIEILRGPQPTLFGKNAIAGAISLTSARPSDVFEGSISTLYEVEHKESKTVAVLSGPIVDQVNARLVASYREVDGWMTNTTLNDKEPNSEQSYVRGIIEWDNGANILMKFKAETSTFDTVGQSIENFSPVGNYSAVFTGVDTQLDYQRQDNGSSSTNQVDTVVFSVDYGFNDHTLTSTTAFLTYDTTEFIDYDYVALNFLSGSSQGESFDQFSQEFRLVSPIGERFDYIAGIYFQTSDLTVRDDVLFGADFAVSPLLTPLVGGNWDRDFSQTADVWSAFLQYVLHATDELSLTVGARYSEEDKSAQRTLVLNGANAAAQAGFAGILGQLGVMAHNVQGDRNESQLDPLVSLQYVLSEDALIYASFTQGSKGGGYDVRSNSAPSVSNGIVTGAFEFQDENAQNYELGAKLAFERGEINLALFLTQYENLQVNQFDGGIGFNVQNAAKADIQGLELDGRVLLAENLVLSGSLAYSRYEYQDYDTAQCASTLVIVQPPSQTVPGLCNFNGLTGAYAPELTGNLNLAYEHDVGDWGILRYALNMDYSDDYFSNVTLDPNTVQSAYTKLDARIALASSEDTWQASIIGNNLTDERVMTSSTTLPLASILTQNTGIAYFGTFERPRNLAVEFTYSF